MSKKKPTGLPPVGSVIADQLPNRLFTIYRVLRAKAIDGPKYVLAVCSPYLSKVCPSDITDEMKLILKTTYPERKGKKPSMYWISLPLDAKSRVIGSVTPSGEDKVADTNSFGHWSNLQQDALKQWCWENDRDKLQALGVAERNEKVARRKRADDLQAAHDAQMKSLTLKKLATYKFFPDWDDFPPPKVIAASRKVLKEHVDKLILLGDTAARLKKSKIIKSCVEAFNALNNQHDDFVDTDIREDIIIELGRLSRASGLGEMTKEVEDWRAW